VSKIRRLETNCQNEATFASGGALMHALLVFYFFALFLVPKSLSLELVGVRAEDVVGLVIITFLPFYGRLITNEAGVIGFMAIFLTYSALVSCVSELLSTAFLDWILLWLKEATLYAVFFVALAVARNDYKKLLDHGLVICSPVIIYGVSQVFSGPDGIYGISPFGHGDSPLSSGVIFFGCFLLNYLRIVLFRKNFTILTLLLCSGICVLLSGSKTSVLMLLIFLFIESVRSRNKALNFGLFSMMGVGFVFLFSRIDFTIWNSLTRYYGFLDPAQVLVERGIWWKLSWLDGGSKILFGNGYGIGQVGVDGQFLFNMAMDNQYLYLLAKFGVLGAVLYSGIILSLYFNIRGRVGRRVFLSLVFAYLAGGLGAEIFHLSASGSLFWIVSGILVGFSRDQPVNLAVSARTGA